MVCWGMSTDTSSIVKGVFIAGVMSAIVIVSGASLVAATADEPIPKRNPTGKGMSVAAARRLHLHRSDLRGDRVCDAVVEIYPSREAVRGRDGRLHWQPTEAGRMVFRFNDRPEHVLELSASDRERITSHFDGFCEAHGLSFQPGKHAWMYSRSAPGGWRRARIIQKQGSKYLVEFRYGYMRGKNYAPIRRSIAARELRAIVV
jgi:hypothetical protein